MEMYWWGADVGNVGDANVAANWIEVDGTAGQVPVAGDILHFDSRASYNTTDDRYQDITAGLLNGEAGWCSFAGVYVHESYNGNIGSAAAPLTFYLSSGEFHYKGAGVAYVMLDNNAGVDSVIGLTVVKCTGGLYLDCESNSGAVHGDYSALWIYSGTVYMNKQSVGEGAFASNIYMLGGYLYGDVDAWNQDNTAYTTFLQVAGEIHWSAGLNTVTQYGGIFWWGQTDDAPASGDIAILTTLTMYNDAIFYWSKNAYSALTSQITVFVMYGAGCVLDATNAVNVNTPKVLGAGADSTVWFGTVKLNATNLTMNATTQIINHGGTIEAPEGAVVDF